MINMEKTGHLAWCALIALLTAWEDGLVASESQENLFITRWFAQGEKTAPLFARRGHRC